jgi:mRNA interferase RelE/StbE
VEKFTFSIEFLDQEALNQFKSLPKSAQKMLGKAIKERLEVDPVSFGKPLRYSLKGHRRLRVSDYRIVYRINDDRRIVTIVAVDHRKGVYDQFD